MNSIATPSIVDEGFLLVPTNFQEAKEIAEYLAKSDIVPKEYRGKPANIVIASTWGMGLGLNYIQALYSISIINGTPALYGDAAHALILSHPDCEDVVETTTGSGAELKAVCTVKRKGRSSVTRQFGVADAMKAGLWDERVKVKVTRGADTYEIRNPSPWFCYPTRMLQMRARGFAERDAFPDALKGIKFVEEVRDYPERDITGEATHTTVAQPKEQEPKPEQASTQEQEPQASKPQEATANDELVLTTGMERIATTKAKDAGLEPEDVAKHFEVPSIAAIPRSKMNDVLAFIKKAKENQS